ncbi:PREDICTED: uncharacterized protein LOC104587128 [Nelumbo nucifera]|uniref:Uncharacterized protein LOC104587128 n=1 Tax=Nelumbo nucifera TaxID=4432 RepID=A0A1U7Z5Z4_NELNU|nr:PREDICTED: uncharacterized protein LOC104587128 [Nelumbo nucifera]
MYDEDSCTHSTLKNQHKFKSKNSSKSSRAQVVNLFCNSIMSTVSASSGAIEAGVTTVFVATLKGFKDMGYVDGTIQCPPKTIEKDSTYTMNPDFILWEQQDQLLLSWILASLSEGVLAQVIGYTISRSVWNALSRLFASKSKSCVMQHRFELTHLKKMNRSMADYLENDRLISDSFTSVGEIVTDSELIQFVLGGLGLDYESLVTTLLLKGEDLSFDGIHAILLNHEIRMQHTRSLFDPISPQANVAMQKQS